ncbi:phospholipase effector Tle1 domain-containing protein, partial [Vibrio splendidus]|uniref:phospholipase effector Tle1 domain-containing protein n=1 Tax=Vibrio splendidus TaxID=29497 RepID=UPI001F5235D8
MGLFDTVGSFYLAGNNDEGNFQLGLEPTMANTVLQLVAEHEYRKNFPLTSLSRDNWLPDNFHQEHFPGCHTDVG